ncbi:MAG: LysM peptidoglycan-binding domain-containing protein [Epsilonproteobacteria bacterium]|nr:LysM peptidoglycan-binding domain-containing protein [Campylobacterota bacterium]MBD3839069.1 LysM peptidoglycan-binding domain-containing protein [Campylobacterota bacterium]
MGLFSFVADKGKKLLGLGNDEEAIKEEITKSFTSMPIENLAVKVEDSLVTLSGVARDQATKEKAILIAGNIDGVESVNADAVTLKPVVVAKPVTPVTTTTTTATQAQPTPVTPVAKPSQFYTIAKGDTLWEIAAKFYGNGSKYKVLVQENLEVIKDENKIYVGQTIRIPAL